MTKPKKPDASEADARPPLFTYYRVRWTFLTRVCGSTPADPDMVRRWLESRMPRVKPAGALSIDEINEEVLASIERGEGEAEQDYSLLVFPKHAGAVVVRASTIRSHIKDCASQVSAQYTGRIQGERSFAVRVKNGVYHDERVYWLPICRLDGSLLTAADGTFDKAVHARTPSGKVISALKRIEYVEPPSILTFTLKVLGRSISETDLHHLFEYGGVHGYGGERGDGEGRYEYTFERIDAPSERAALTHG